MSLRWRTTRYHINERTTINTLVAHWMFCFAILPGKFWENSLLCHGSVRKKPKYVMICFWLNRFHVSCTRTTYCIALIWNLKVFSGFYCCRFCICVCGHHLILHAIKRDHKIVNDLHSINALHGPELVSFVWSLIDMCVFVGGWVYSAFINSVNDRNTRIQNGTRIVRRQIFFVVVWSSIVRMNCASQTEAPTHTTWNKWIRFIFVSFIWNFIEIKWKQRKKICKTVSRKTATAEHTKLWRTKWAIRSLPLNLHGFSLLFASRHCCVGAKVEAC